MSKYIWLIAHVDSSKVEQLHKDIKKFPEYQLEIEAKVPTVRILKKQFKGKDIFNDVPLLFNYGFFKIPVAWAINKDILELITQRLSCITHWVKDPAKKGLTQLPLRTDTHATIKRLIPYATCTDDEVERMVKVAKEESIHSSTDIENLKVGDIINLIGYPFEGMEATVRSIDKKGKQVLVEIASLGFSREVKVSFDNIFYSIYRGSYNEVYNREKTLTDYQSKNASYETE